MGLYPSPVPDAPNILDQPRYAAIHRAVLSGLLSNIARHREQREYEGVRGRTLVIWPGSTLRRHRPQWIVSAEMVQTTQLYARTVATIRPEWIEDAAGHLVRRTWDEIRWDRDAAEVVADEKVTLWGMTLVPRRVVPYGPVDPKTSRTVFIQQALVEGAYRSEAPFWRNNQRLIEEVRTLQNKARTRDLLVDPKARHDFYDARIPEGIYNAQAFEQWRRGAEKRHPRLLFMSRHDLMLHGAQGITPDLFPDTMDLAGASVPLTYHLEPGHAMDGVTATLPVAALGQVSSERLDWLVPGMLRDKLIALVKTLPKALRTQFVPAPDTVDRIMPRLKFGQGSLAEQLAHELGREAGVAIAPSAIQMHEVPDHLKMNCRVLDERGRQLAMGRDLEDVRSTLRAQIREAFAHLPRGPWVRDDLKSWDFGDLPQRVQIQHKGMTLWAYPGLVDAGSSASLRLFDSAESAAKSTRAGLRRLFMTQLRQEMRYLWSHLPNIDRMSLHFAPLGPSEELRTELTGAIAERVFLEDWASIRTQAEYERRVQTAWRRVEPIGRELSEAAGLILAAFHEVSVKLEKAFPPAWRDSVQDMRQQLGALVPKQFLSATPHAWLGHVPRFIKGIDVRLTKLANAGLARDRQKMAQVRPLWDDYGQRLAQQRQAGVSDPILAELRWMIEELRISLFAQELRTSMPISVKRCQEQLARAWG